MTTHQIFHARSALMLVSWAFSIASAAAAEPPNLVLNGDFSQVQDGKPANWQATGDAKDVTQALSVEKDADGRAVAKLACTRFDYRGGASHAMLAQVGGVRLTKGKLYEFSCRMKADDLRGRSVHVALQDTRDWDSSGLYEDFPVGPARRTYRRSFRAMRDVGPTGRLQIWFLETGTLWVGDVRIVDLAGHQVDFTDVVPDAGSRNLVRNGSFEAGGDGWASMGQGTGWGDLCELHGRVVEGDAADGKRFLRVPLGGQATPVLWFDYLEPVVRREVRPLAASLGWIKVGQGTACTVSCQMRASREGVRAAVGARSAQPAGGWTDHRQLVHLTKEWKRYSLTFRSPHDYVFAMVGPDLEKEEDVEVDIDAVQVERAQHANEFQPHQAVEFALEPSQPGGVFAVGEKAALVLRVCNRGPAACQAKVTFAVTDFDNRGVDLSAQAIDVPAGQQAVREVALPADWRGFYRVRAKLAAGPCSQTADLRLAVVPARTGDDSPVGINHAFADNRLVRIARKAGVAWYRDWSVRWQTCEPVQGQFQWGRPAAQIDRVLREQVHCLPLLPPFPSADWSSQAPLSLAGTGYPAVRIRQAYAPKDPKDLACFVGRAVEQFKDRIHVWEFLNEPIYTDYALPGRSGPGGAPRYTVDDYVSLLGVAAGAMRKADPACRVIGGIAAGPAQYAREVIRAGCLQHLDIFNLHDYPGSRMPEGYIGEMKALRAEMERAGGVKPIWITEFAYYGADDLPWRPFIPPDNSWSDLRLLDSELQCAQYTVRFFAIMMAMGTEKIFIHAGASGRPNSHNFECPLFVNGPGATKLLPALAVFADLVGPAPKNPVLREIRPGVYGAAFETGKNSLLMLWSQDDQGSERLDAPQEASPQWLDMMGRPLKVEAPIRPSPSPIYGLLPPGKAAQVLAGLQARK